ncbi:MAG: hypothetical protein JAZ15_05690 [Candidatus Thiodiazotropha endolucinida]|nr:hypothetical protein [Candidatus Thiodiazotropha taylori]MCW4312494.1 hypothetical protein [Candidatus Thiodiazotropha taylori]
MRDDVFIKEVLGKCNTLKQAGFWPTEPTIRPNAWLHNFEPEDQATAAILLDRFTYYNQKLTDALFLSSYHSIGDGLPKGPNTPSLSELIRSLTNARITPITGEAPNPTDSGNLFCRKARQLLAIDDHIVVEPRAALDHARAGGTIVFVDDFIGSGDQFLETWRRPYSRTEPSSFFNCHAQNGFTSIYLSLVSTDFGLNNIQRFAPNTAVCVSHILCKRSTIQGMEISDQKRQKCIDFLEKYSARLQPRETYIASNPKYRAFGYKERGLLFGFEHSIPDATLPIFWSPGVGNWEPLIERV